MTVKTLQEVISLFKDADGLTVPLATGQPQALLNALGERSDWKDLYVFCGLLAAPYKLLMHPGVRCTSGYYGPVERHLNKAGARMQYLPSNFRGFDHFARRHPTRVISTVLSEPDRDGYCTFGTHGAAAYNPFVAACHDDSRLAIAEINKTMPVVYGDEEYGDNKIHIDDIDVVYEVDAPQAVLPPSELDDVSKKIAEHVLPLIPEGAVLQFGIGPVPDYVASQLAQGPLGNFGIHSEMISDGFVELAQAGKITNQTKGNFKGQSIYTFAFGSQKLYDFVDERNGENNRSTICLPVLQVNEPALMEEHECFVSLNSGLMVDFAGQVCSESIGLAQYSGVGGQLSFVEGAKRSPQGRSIICIKSTATVEGQTISNIMPVFPEGAIVSTPRHFTQTIVTEYGVADLEGVGDEHRAEKLIAVAHPDFRQDLMQAFAQQKKLFYKN